MYKNATNSRIQSIRGKYQKNPPKNWEGFIIEQKVELKLILV